MNETYRKALEPLFAGRLVVLFGSAASRLTHMAKQCLELGSRRVLVLAWASHGIGLGPLPSDVQLLSPFPLETSGDGMRIVLPSHILEGLRTFDPHREALVIGSGSTSSCLIDGRAIINARPKLQEQYESKLISEQILSTVMDRKELTRIMGISHRNFYGQCSQIDLGDGIVLSGDSSTGPGTAGSHVWWVTNSAQAVNAVKHLRSNGGMVRVMPYVRGIPASMHGLVLADGLITCPPMQLINLLRSSDGHVATRFFTAGSATLSVLDSHLMARMRTLIRSIGEELAARVGYRGMYCVDGIVTEDSFIPTEINTREGSSIGVHFSLADEVPIQLLNAAALSTTAVASSARELDTALEMTSPKARIAITWKDFVAAPLQCNRFRDNARTLGIAPRSIGPFDLEVTKMLEPDSSFIVYGKARSWGDGKPMTLLNAAAAFWNDVDDQLQLGLGGVEPPIV